MAHLSYVLACTDTAFRRVSTFHRTLSLLFSFSNTFRLARDSLSDIPSSFLTPSLFRPRLPRTLLLHTGFTVGYPISYYFYVYSHYPLHERFTHARSSPSDTPLSHFCSSSSLSTYVIHNFTNNSHMREVHSHKFRSFTTFIITALTDDLLTGTPIVHNTSFCQRKTPYPMVQGEPSQCTGHTQQMFK